MSASTVGSVTASEGQQVVGPSVPQHRYETVLMFLFSTLFLLSISILPVSRELIFLCLTG